MAYTPDQLKQNLLLSVMDAPSHGGNVSDNLGSNAPSVIGAFGKAAGWRSANPALGMGIGIGGEILGSLLKPKHDTANVNSPFANYLNRYKRRMEGSGDGILGGAAKWGGRGAQVGSVIPGIGTAIGGAAGAVGGAIANAFTKNAKSAYTDFSVDNARQAIRDIYKNEGGRDVDDATINQILQGQGWKQGSHWVGEKGMMGVLGNLRGNFQKEKMQQQALLSQMGGQA